MLWLAREAGLPAAEGAACEWDEAGLRKRGIVARSFINRAREQLSSGMARMARECGFLACWLPRYAQYSRGRSSKHRSVMASRSPQDIHRDSARASATLAGAARVSARPERLWVMWGEPKEGRRRTIGELWRDSAGYAFCYVPEVAGAQAEGFRLLPSAARGHGQQPGRPRLCDCSARAVTTRAFGSVRAWHAAAEGQRGPFRGQPFPSRR